MFEDLEEDEPVKSYSKAKKGTGAGTIWLVALAAILVPTVLFVALMLVAHDKSRDAALKASEENSALMKKHPGKKDVMSDNDLRTFEKNIAIIERGNASFGVFVVAANLLYLLLFIPYILIVLITAVCLSQAAKG